MDEWIGDRWIDRQMNGLLDEIDLQTNNKIFNCPELFFNGMTGALAPFRYLVSLQSVNSRQYQLILTLSRKYFGYLITKTLLCMLSSTTQASMQVNILIQMLITIVECFQNCPQLIAFTTVIFASDHNNNFVPATMLPYFFVTAVNYNCKILTKLSSPNSACIFLTIFLKISL